MWELTVIHKQPCFSVWIKLQSYSFRFLYTCVTQRGTMTAPVEYNEQPCLGLLSFHTEAVQLSSQLWAWQCSCHGNQNNHFILLDLAGQMFPWAEQAPQTYQDYRGTDDRKVQQGAAQNRKAQTLQQHGGGGSWGDRAGDPLNTRRPLHAIPLWLLGGLCSLVWWLGREIQPPTQPTKQPNTKVNPSHPPKK